MRKFALTLTAAALALGAAAIAVSAQTQSQSAAGFLAQFEERDADHHAGGVHRKNGRPRLRPGMGVEWRPLRSLLVKAQYQSETIEATFGRPPLFSMPRA